jgi:hypothetical protein
MNPTGLSVIRTKLRDVNVEYSALVRAKGSEDRFVRMHELKVERQALMALMAGLAGTHGALGMAPLPLPSDAPAT